MTRRLAVVGGGPKGAAIAAKAAALRRSGHSVPDIVVFEQDQPGSAWSGLAGYTDGLQPLCTLAERDLGFPYDRDTFGTGVAHTMLADFSWPAFAVREGLDHAQYEQWVLLGRNPPAHADFASYLAAALRDSGAQLVQAQVEALDFDSAKRQWRVSSIDASGHRNDDFFEGVVVTGSGEPLPPLSSANARVFDGKSFWTSLSAVSHLLRTDPDPSVVIIGAGGTGAAIAHWFIRTGITAVPMTIVGREPTLYARHPGPFEDRLFTDEDAWSRLAGHVRDEFVRRLTSGVVWDYVLRNLVSDNIVYECYEAKQFVPRGPVLGGLPPELTVELHHPQDPADVQRRNILQAVGQMLSPARPAVPATSLDASVFIDARGFDRWWFVDRLLSSSTLKAHFAEANRPSVLVDVDRSLAVGGSFPPGLHVPMLASRQGPAASNLMALGWMSDRILEAY